MLLSILNEPWENVSMNFMMQFLEWNINPILVVVNKLSKLVKWLQQRQQLSIQQKNNSNMWVRHHRVPEYFISDRDAKFTMNFLKYLFWKVGNKLFFSTIFHPQTDGQTKRVNGVLNQYFWKYVNVYERDWGKNLGLA
jgi:hypothetical protein